jgi:hypothetical protein
MLPVDESVPVRVTHGLAVFGGLSGLPHWLNTAMSYLPAQPMIDAVTRAAAFGRPRHARAAGAANPARSV